MWWLIGFAVLLVIFNLYEKWSVGKYSERFACNILCEDDIKKTAYVNPYEILRKVSSRAGITTPKLYVRNAVCESAFVDYEFFNPYIVVFIDDLTEGEEALEGTLAHEVGHIVNINWYDYLYVGLLLLSYFTLYAVPLFLILIMCQKFFQRWEEYRADEKVLLYSEYPLAFIQVFKEKAEERESWYKMTRRGDKVHAFLHNTHPSYTDRVKHLEKMMKKRK